MGSEMCIRDRPLAILRGGANANETYHVTGSDPEGSGAYQVMKRALAVAGLDAVMVDYVHAHGTATRDNDLAEGRAVRKLFGDGAIFVSTKGYTGHTLAASGALNAVISLLGLNTNNIWGNINFKDEDPEIGISPLKDTLDRPHKNIMINSFGFGGNNCSLVISRPT